MVNLSEADDAGHLAPDALVALRNRRLWEAHAPRCSGPERDHALQMASQWDGAYQMLKATPGERRVALRRGDRDVNPKETAYTIFMSVALLGLFIYMGYALITH